MKQLLFCIIILSAACNLSARESVRWGNPDTDSLAVRDILTHLQGIANPTPTDAARCFLGRPYVGATLEGEPETLTVCTEAFDCTTLVEVSVALAKAAATSDPTVDTFLDLLTALRYRNGEIDGYAGRLHYISDWIANAQRHNLLTEVTDQLPWCVHIDKPLNFMSTHTASYPALKNNPGNVAAIKKCEAPFSNYRMPMIPKDKVLPEVTRLLQEGDIVAFTTGIPGLDVSHVGLVTIIDNVPHLMHASSAQKEVVITHQTLVDYLKGNKKITGIRIFRQYR